MFIILEPETLAKSLCNSPVMKRSGTNCLLKSTASRATLKFLRCRDLKVGDPEGELPSKRAKGKGRAQP
jgi:hypothetical protein